ELDAAGARLLAHEVPVVGGLAPAGHGVVVRHRAALTEEGRAEDLGDVELGVDVVRAQGPVAAHGPQTVVVEQLADLLRGDVSRTTLGVAGELDLGVADVGELLEQPGEADAVAPAE